MSYVWEKIYNSSNVASGLAGWYGACEKQAKNVLALRQALAREERKLTADLHELRIRVEQYNELHTEHVDADELVAAIMESMSDREQEGVTPDALSDQAQP